MAENRRLLAPVATTSIEEQPVVCGSCGTENPAHAKYCLECAAPLAAGAATREVRKVVTVVFCDITGSTALGESIEPEALRALLGRYFERMRAIVELHGGTVEKFIGDAVMAVFGVPVVHEDDALRAVRAAAEMRAALPELGVDARIGVNTGEVIAAGDGTLVTGDAVNVAARLEQAAPPGEVYVGPRTFELARGAASFERVEPLLLKGKADPFEAHRLVALEDASARRFETSFVGRERELRLVREAFELAASDRVCQLFTLLGVAGVGKSRLVAEALGSIDATVLRGRCLSYGEGITFWPVVEVVKQLRPEERDLDERVSGPLEVLLGGEATTSKEEIGFALRRLFETVADERPLVVVWDDLHWAEDAFLDLVESVADWARDAPILLLCMARPEFLDRRPGWAGGKLHAATVLLEPLGREASIRLLGDLAGELEEPLRERILAASEGNPLFVEEMVAMLESSAVEEVVVPPSIQALLAARLDQLPDPERAALECGAVEGQVFHRSAVQALAADGAEVAPHLLRLVRKELVRPERPQLPGDEAFRFRHILIRDAAYDALPKTTRAELHERFADWLEEHGRDLVELDEIAGYHLERAAGYLRELRTAEGKARSLARRASVRLGTAARAAGARDDLHAAATLNKRSVELLDRDDPERPERLVALAEAYLGVDELRASQAVANNALALAQAAADERVAALAGVAAISASLQLAPDETGEASLAEAERLASILDELGTVGDRARARALQGRILFFLGRTEAALSTSQVALTLAREAGDRRVESGIVIDTVAARVHGATPAPEALAFVDELLAQPWDPTIHSFLLQKRSRVDAMLGHIEQARADYGRARALALEYGLRLRRGVQTQDGASLELAAGDPVAAEHELREGYELLADLGETGFRSSVAAYLADALFAQGRLDEAAEAAEDALALAQADDFDPIGRAYSTKARIAAAGGDLETAKTLAHRAVEMMEPSEYLQRRGDTLLAQAHVLLASGEHVQAAAAAAAALDLYERKGDVRRAAATRGLLDSFEGA